VKAGARDIDQLRSKLMKKGLNDDRCTGLTRAGKPCRAAATEGGLCFFHANPNKVSELGRIGGRSRSRLAAEPTDPLPTLDTARAVRDFGARLIAEVYAGKVAPKIAAGLAPLLGLQLRSVQTEAEVRLVRLEKVVDRLQADAERRRHNRLEPERLADNRHLGQELLGI
jgi:hypothetical protein